MLIYYITDRRQFGGSGDQQRAALLGKIAEAARAGVDYIQLREKDLTTRELLDLAQQAVSIVGATAAHAPATRESQPGTRLLINSRIDVAIASAAGGVHLRSDDISARDARMVYAKSAAARDSELAARPFLIATSCHTAEDVRRAESDGSDFVVLAPVFEKGGQRGVGLVPLRAACRGMPKIATPESSPAVHIPVLALGGVTVENARACLDAGAAGIAGIRLFQDHDVAQVVAQLRTAG